MFYYTIKSRLVALIRVFFNKKRACITKCNKIQNHNHKAGASSLGAGLKQKQRKGGLDLGCIGKKW